MCAVGYVEKTQMPDMAEELACGKVLAGKRALVTGGSRRHRQGNRAGLG